MRLADYVAEFVVGLGVTEVFTVVGAGAMHLNDAFGNQPGLNYIATQHEQGAAMAGEGYARIRGDLGVILVTSGPGGTNALTGVCGAWVDSIPMLVISGQVSVNNMIGETGLRQFGVQELDTIRIVSTVTKYAVSITEARQIRYHLEKATHLARSKRPGPVWIEIPVDIQGRMVDPEKLPGFEPAPPFRTPGAEYLKHQTEKAAAMLTAADRPIIYAGYGIRLAGACDQFQDLVDKLRVPVISSWNASDLIPTEHAKYAGRCGILGDRAGNFAVQNADLLLVIGSRMSLPQTGYNFSMFARKAKQIVVDIDEKEMMKPSLRTDLPIVADAGDFINLLSQKLEEYKGSDAQRNWLARCQERKAAYPIVLDEYRGPAGQVNSYVFIEALSAKLPEGAVVVTDMGTAFTCTMQTFSTKYRQRLFTSSGLAAMGFGLPGAIGACFASGRQRVICVAGDGGLQMSVQEIQTVVHYKLPITLFVLDNSGYMSIRWTQATHYGREVCAGPGSGQSSPDFVKVGEAYGLPSVRIENQDCLSTELDQALAAEGPLICVVKMPDMQELIPRVSTQRFDDGSLIAKPLEDMFPFMDREEFRKNMDIEPIEE